MSLYSPAPGVALGDPHAEDEDEDEEEEEEEEALPINSDCCCSCWSGGGETAPTAPPPRSLPTPPKVEGLNKVVVVTGETRPIEGRGEDRFPSMEEGIDLPPPPP